MVEKHISFCEDVGPWCGSVSSSLSMSQLAQTEISQQLLDVVENECVPRLRCFTESNEFYSYIDTDTNF